LGSKRRLVATIEWLREFPKAGPLPQLWHTFAIAMQDGSRIEVPPRLNGPVGSGQGGYSCGLVGTLVGNPAEVTLRAPVPLGRPLSVDRLAEGGVAVRDGETLVAEARGVESLDLDVPDPPSVEEAERASVGYVSPRDIFAHCFVCGSEREDGQRVFPASVAGRDLVASTWTPRDEWLAADGVVRPEFVWAVLDCPTYFASALERPKMLAVLGRLTVELLGPVRIDHPHVVMSWPLDSQGRKHPAGCALASAEGEVLAVGRGLHLEVSEVPSPAAPTASR
jgi:hypothetical protein